MSNYPMVDEVNRLVGNLLAAGSGVFLPGVGSLFVERRGARRLSKRSVQPPCRVVSFSSQQQGVSLADELARTLHCDAAGAQDVYDRWLSRTREGDVLTIEGVGVLKFKNFTLAPAFDRLLNPQGHEVVSQKELGITLEPEETGTTFAANALIKAETICKASGMATIADDSGLCVDALDGAPGVYSARYCGHHGDDEANNDQLLENMKDVPAGKRGAKFVSAVCFILPDGKHLTCMGECPGKVAFERLAGDYGFGYDPLFIPDECGVGKTGKRPNTEGRSYAQLTPDEKDAISHRGNALAELEKELPKFLAK